MPGNCAVHSGGMRWQLCKLWLPGHVARGVESGREWECHKWQRLRPGVKVVFGG